MCGIAGIIGNISVENGRNELGIMLNAIKHRGPDDRGIWSKEGFAFGMQRLSIIDLEGGQQPIWHKDVAVIFNGEIYNFKHLRKNLEQEGCVFKTQSDTEVILLLYQKEGIQFVHKLEGMFAICIYDGQKNKMYLIRDRMGVKPLYFGKIAGKFYFASEMKAIIKTLHHKPEINHQAIYDFLTLRYIPGPTSIWKDIQKLESGHFMEYNLSNHHYNIMRYWQFNFHSESEDTKRPYLEEFENLFLQAVEKRLLASDVPVGVLLSGGLDSSAITAAAVELGHRNFHSFSVGFEEGGQFNELHFAGKLAKDLQLQHHEIMIGQKEFIDFLPQFAYAADEPLADLASIPLYYVSKLASKNVKVVLSGEGSDEVLAGYSLDNTARFLSNLALVDRYLPRFLCRYLPYDSLKMLSKVGFRNILRYQRVHMTRVFNEQEKRALIKTDYLSQYSTEDLIQSWYDKSLSNQPLDQLQDVYCRSWLVEDLLMKADKMSMATSLELRVPFLDHKLVEWAAKLPLVWKVGDRKNGFTTKRILKQFSLKRLPGYIINRPKWGFPVPAYHWLQNALNDWAKAQLMEGKISEIINQSVVLTEMKRLSSGNHHSAHKIWNLLILNQWMNCWL